MSPSRAHSPLSILSASDPSWWVRGRGRAFFDHPWLKADPRTAHIPVLACSAHAYSDPIVRAKAAGVDVFLIKPCLPKTVLSTIREMLNLPGKSRQDAFLL